MHQVITKGSRIEKGPRTGSVMDLMHTRAVSCTRAGKPRSVETRKKISENNARYWLGKKRPFAVPMSPEHKERLRQLSIGRVPWNKGKKVSEETRMRMREAHRGEKSPFWKGGITKEHQRIRGSVEMRIWREAVFKRDDYTCVWCGVRGVYLNADHIKSFAHYPELRFEVSNGRTLCEPCHRKTPTFRNKKKI